MPIERFRITPHPLAQLGPSAELVCTDLESVCTAVRLGADRVEVCAALEVGGVTPGIGFLEAACLAASSSDTEVVALIRPRRGDFVLTGPGDLDVLRREIRAARDVGAKGVAIGVLDAAGDLDEAAMAALIAEARPMKVTLHRAIDQARSHGFVAERAVALGVDRILTSGAANTAWDGRGVIEALANRYAGTVEVIAAGGITGANAAAVIAATRAGAIHGSCSIDISEGARASQSVPSLGVGEAAGAGARRTLDEVSAHAFVAAARAIGETGVELEVHATGDAAAAAVAHDLVNLVAAKPHAVLGLATGGTMMPVYAHVVREARARDVSFARVTTFNLDEYCALPEGSPHSFRQTMEAALFGPLDMRRDHCFFPSPANAADEGAAGESGPTGDVVSSYEEQIERAGGIDLQLLGIGRNGHIAFNEPGAPAASLTRVVPLASETREDATSTFGALATVPTHAITMGLCSIMAAKQLRLVALGTSKADIVERALEGPASSLVPASLIRGAAGLVVVLDEAAAASLSHSLRGAAGRDAQRGS